MRGAETSRTGRWRVRSALTMLLLCVATTGCARLPYTTKVLHEDPRVMVSVQQEVKPARYTHPVQVTAVEVASLLRGFTLREKQRLPLRWFAEEAPPKRIFREDELQVLAPPLADALRKVGPEERVHFQIIAPGYNPKIRNDVVGGWMAVREPYLHLAMEYFHTQIPTTKSDPYYASGRFSTPPPPPKSYLLYFEPGRFWVTDEKGARAVEFRQFLKSAEATDTGRSQPTFPAGVP